MFKDNLIIKNLLYNNNFIQIKKHPSWEKSLIIYHENSIFESNMFDLFIILKSYCDNMNGFVESIYVILTFPKPNKFQIKTIFLEKIEMFKLKEVNSEEEFIDWWDKIILKLWIYEVEGRKINFLINLNILNVKQKFNLKDLKNTYYLQPDFPWKKPLLLFLNEEKSFKLKTSNIIRQQHLMINMYKITITITITITIFILILFFQI